MKREKGGSEEKKTKEKRKVEVKKTKMRKIIRDRMGKEVKEVYRKDGTCREASVTGNQQERKRK